MRSNEFFPQFLSAHCVAKIAGKPLNSCQFACFAGKILLFALFYGAADFAGATELYHTNRTFTPVQFDIQGNPTLYELNSNADKLTGIVKGTNIVIDTTNTYAIEKQAAIALGYSSATSAWNAVIAYNGISSNYMGKIYDNVGWARGTKSVTTNWGAYLWVIQNQIVFQSSTSEWWRTTNGVPVVITNVFVGSLGNYGPMSNVVDIGPHLDAATNNYPGADQGETNEYRADWTNVFYQLSIPDIWIMPREAVAAVGSTNPVQFTVYGTNIPNGVTWMIIPDGLTSGAVIQASNDWHYASVTPGSVATNYKVRATSVDNTNFYDEVDLTVLKVDIVETNVYVEITKTTNFHLTPDSSTNVQWEITPTVQNGASIAGSSLGTSIVVNAGSVSTNYIIRAYAVNLTNCYDTALLQVFQVTLHPKAADFASGKAGRIMISTMQDNLYYTSVPTTKNNSGAQTNDRVVFVTAHLPPGLAGATVYFQVVDPDPDDLSQYETNAVTGDNLDPNVLAGTLSAANAVAELKTINGLEVAAAEVALTITDRYAGDNYQVLCSLDPNWTTTNDCTCALVAWKRIYYEYDRMYKNGSDLAADFTPDGDGNPDSVSVADGALFATNDTVVIFDADHPSGETAQVTNIAGNTLGLNIDLTNSYNAGYNSGDKGAAVAIPSYGLCSTSFERLLNAYGSSTDGSDGGCFVEFADLGAGNYVPCWTNLVNKGSGNEYDNLVKFTDIWFSNASQAGNNYIHLVAAQYYLKSDGVYGISCTNNTENWIYIFTSEIHDKEYQNENAALGETTAHEFGHHFGLQRGDNGDGHVDEDVYYFNHNSSDECIMSNYANACDDDSEFCYDGESDCIDDIRGAADGL